MDLPFLTSHIPGCGGVFKASPEDFEVEELPAYEPNGLSDGEHAFVWIEKRGRTTQDAARLISRHLGLDDREVSWAGLKDRNAVTRQWLSLPWKSAGKLEGLSAPGLTVLRVVRHRNKLKSGHLRGNRFSLIVRGVTDETAARASFDELCSKGLPNAFGAQRFGVKGDNADRGRRILQSGGRHADRFERKLLLSAFQSFLFNEVLALRLSRGLFGSVLLGDVLKKHETGGEFVSTDPTVDQPRADAFEVSPTGPMFGPEMRSPENDCAALEAEVLAAQQVTKELFVAGRNETRGARRLLRVRVAEPKLETVNAGVLKITFALPAGSYASVVLRELLKRDEPGSVEPGD